MKKSIIGWGILCFGFLVLSGVGVSLAWFTDQDEKVNFISPGTNDVTIEEEFPDPELTPDKEVEKEVTFTNMGTVPCYVRAKFDYSTLEAQENTEIIFGDKGWKKEKDGYYYYDKYIFPGERTEPFLKAVKMIENGELETDFDLTVYTETVQSENYDTPLEAFSHLEA